MEIDVKDRYQIRILVNTLRNCSEETTGDAACRKCPFANQPGDCLTNLHFTVADLLEKLSGLKK